MSDSEIRSVAARLGRHADREFSNLTNDRTLTTARRAVRAHLFNVSDAIMGRDIIEPDPKLAELLSSIAAQFPTGIEHRDAFLDPPGQTATFPTFDELSEILDGLDHLGGIAKSSAATRSSTAPATTC